MFIIEIKILTIVDVFLLFCRASFRDENFTSVKMFLASSLGEPRLSEQVRNSSIGITRKFLQPSLFSVNIKVLL